MTRSAGPRRARRTSRNLMLLGVLLGLILGLYRSVLAARSFDVVMAAPAMDPYGMAVVERARTPQRFEFGTSLSLGFAHRPFHPSMSRPTGEVGRVDLIANQLSVDLGFYLGLTNWLSIAAMLPMGVNFYDADALGQPTIAQTPTAQNPSGMPSTSGVYNNSPRQNVEVSSAGPRDPRLALKACFFSGRYVQLGTQLALTLPLGDSASFLGEKNVTFGPRLLFGVLLGRIKLALSFGGIVRQRAEFFDPATNALLFQVSHELDFGAGVSLLAHKLFALGIESFGTIPVKGDATFATVALLGSLWLQPIENWRIQISGGSGLLFDNPRNAEGRVLVGLAYSFAPRAGGLL